MLTDIFNCANDRHVVYRRGASPKQYPRSSFLEKLASTHSLSTRSHIPWPMLAKSFSSYYIFIYMMLFHTISRIWICISGWQRNRVFYRTGTKYIIDWITNCMVCCFSNNGWIFLANHPHCLVVELVESTTVE